MKNGKSNTPEVWISSWVDADDSGNWEEKGITLQWELPADVYAMMVEVDDVEWGPFLERERALTIPYPNDDRTEKEDPVCVRLRYLEYSKELELKILKKINEITLIMADVILTKSGGGSGTYCPTGNYNTLKTASRVGNYWQIAYSDKYGNGDYRALLLTIRTSDNQDEAICSIVPGAATSTTQDEAYTAAVCESGMRGDFTESTLNNRGVLTVDLGDITATISTYRDTDTDSMVVRVECPADFTVEGLLHDA